MKAADYRIPWGRPSEHLLAVKREIIDQQKHMQRIQDARNRSTTNTEAPECAHMPHLITRPKKKKLQEDRQREIAAENSSLMNRLAGIMREDRGDPVKKYAHLSVEYRQSLRRKKLLKVETENRRLARSIKKQKPFYANRAMEKEEDDRQALLKTMSRTERRKERVAMFKMPGRNCDGNHHPHRNPTLLSGLKEGQDLSSASLVEDGVLFRPGQTVVNLRTAQQMRLEVARRRHVEGGRCGRYEGDDGNDDYDQKHSSAAGYDHQGNESGVRGGVPLSSATTAAGALTIQRRAYGSGSSDGGGGGGSGPAFQRGGVVLEVNRTGGGGGGGGGGRRRGASVEGRPNLIFTPSVVPVGIESVRASPMTLGGTSSVQRPEGREATAESAGDGDPLLGGAEADVPDRLPRETRTV